MKQTKELLDQKKRDWFHGRKPLTSVEKARKESLAMIESLAAGA